MQTGDSGEYRGEDDAAGEEQAGLGAPGGARNWQVSAAETAGFG